MEARVELAGVVSLSLEHGSQGLNSGHPAWPQVVLLAEPPCQLLYFYFLNDTFVFFFP